MTEQTIKLPQQEAILRVKTLPNDANRSGDIFGGWLMSQIDIAGAIVATKHGQGHMVTVAVKQLLLLKPLFIYDLVSFYANVKAVGKTSITVDVEVYAQRAPLWKEVEKISDATLVYVAVSKPGVKRELPK
jgi:acyl-CoA thioesterase YciA